MASPVGNNPPNWTPPSNNEVKNTQPDQSADNTLQTRFDSFVLKVQEFMGEIKDLPNYLQEIPEEKQVQLQQLTEEAHELFSLHPLFNLESARTLHDQMKKDHKSMVDEREKLKSDFLKDLVQEGSEDDESKQLLALMQNQLLSSLTFDCGGLFKMEERQMKMLEIGICELDKVIRFQENPKEPLSEQTKFPLIEVSFSVKRLLESGLFQ